MNAQLDDANRLKIVKLRNELIDDLKLEIIVRNRSTQLKGQIQALEATSFPRCEAMIWKLRDCRIGEMRCELDLKIRTVELQEQLRALEVRAYTLAELARRAMFTTMRATMISTLRKELIEELDRKLTTLRTPCWPVNSPPTLSEVVVCP